MKMTGSMFAFNKQLSIKLCSSYICDDDSLIDYSFQLLDQKNMEFCYVPYSLFSKDAMELMCDATRRSVGDLVNTFVLKYNYYRVEMIFVYHNRYYHSTNANEQNHKLKWIHRTNIRIWHHHDLHFYTDLMYSQPFNERTYKRYLQWLIQQSIIRN